MIDIDFISFVSFFLFCFLLPSLFRSHAITFAIVICYLLLGLPLLYVISVTISISYRLYLSSLLLSHFLSPLFVISVTLSLPSPFLISPISYLCYLVHFSSPLFVISVTLSISHLPYMLSLLSSPFIIVSSCYLLLSPFFLHFISPVEVISVTLSIFFISSISYLCYSLHFLSPLFLISLTLVPYLLFLLSLLLLIPYLLYKLSVLPSPLLISSVCYLCYLRELKPGSGFIMSN